MHIVQLPRQGGKTTYAVDWLRAQSNRILIVPNTGMKRIIQDAHADLAHRIVSADSFSRYGARGKFPPGTEIGIDELDMVLSTLLSIFGAPGQLSMGTITPGDYQPSLFGMDPEPQIPPDVPQPLPGAYFTPGDPYQPRYDHLYQPQSPHHWTWSSEPTTTKVTLGEIQDALGMGKSGEVEP